jgi:hypothetical protein
LGGSVLAGAFRQRIRAALAAVAAAALGVHAARAQEPAAPSYETPPMQHAPDLAPAQLLEGPGFRVEDAVPTDGVLARFTIRADVGSFEAHGVETLAVRVAEIGAIRALDRAVQSEAFGKASAAAAARPSDSPRLEAGIAAAVGTDPFLERLFGAGPTGSGSLDRVKIELGHEQEVRELAQRLGVDPYSTHPVLASKLRDVAWIAFAGGGARDSIAPAVPAERPALPGSATARGWVYSTSRAELTAKNAERMRGMGASEETLRAVATAPALSLSLQTALVEALGRIGGASGRAEVLAAAAALDNPDQALFLARAAGILADRNEQAPVAAILSRDPFVARQQSGQLVVVVPGDAVAWTERIAEFAKRADLAAPERAFWISGRASTRARLELEALGFAVHEGVKP